VCSCPVLDLHNSFDVPPLKTSSWLAQLFNVELAKPLTWNLRSGLLNIGESKARE
jgi:hypothetical protein